MKSVMLILVLGVMLSACTNEKVEVLKSPCASAADDGPCGPKRPVNDWWQHAKQAV